MRTRCKNRLSFDRIKTKQHRKSLQITTNHYKPPQSQRCGGGSPGDDVRSHVQAWAWNAFVGEDCRRFCLSPFWLFVAVLTICRRFGLSPYWLSPFWFVAVLVSPFWLSPFWFVAVLTIDPAKEEEEEEEFICQVYNNNNNNRKNDTLTGCQGGYTPINAGRLWQIICNMKAILTE